MGELRVLGAVEAWAGERRVDVGHPRQQCVLVALAVDANRVVAADQLLDRVWGEHVPLRGRETLYTYLSRLRRALAALDEVAIVRRSGGWELQADPDAVDLHRFHRLLDRARTAPDPVTEMALVEQALVLWRGEAFTGLDTPWIGSVRESLAQRRLAAELDHTDLALQAGKHTELLATLAARAGEHPLDERVAAQYLLALYRCGRQADALALYQTVRERLAEELGADPGPDLQALYRRVLTADATLTVTGPPPADGHPVPRQLPPAPPHFTGRAAELATLTSALGAAAGHGATVVISALTGAGGIGKTWLALHWAHRHADRFPDGQLFVDLQGFSPTGRPVEPDDAVRGFLTALGVAPERVPGDPHAKAALYRSLVAGKRVLVVLDNAATADQVVPLLPGSPTCTVLVTGRHRLASLIDRYGARHLQLDVLTADEARVLLTGRLGAERVAAEPDATDELIDLCGRYPLALSIMARHAHTRPRVPLAEFAAELRELGLDMLDHHDDPAASLPTVLSWSLRDLTAEQRTVFALLGIAPGPDTTLPAVVCLTGLSPARARQALSALEEASLVERRPHGRYAMHDLVRDYATTTAHTTLPDDVRETALARVVDFHLHTAHTADRLLDSHRPLVQLDLPAPGVHPLPLPDAAAATAWFDAEHATLLAAQRAAVALGRHHVVWHLAWTLDAFYRRRGHRRDALAAWRAALDAANHLPDPTARIHAHRNLGHACSRLGLHEEATDHLDRALDLAVRHHDPTEQAYTHRTLAAAWGERGDNRRALEHARHALDLHRSLDLPVREADALNAAGWFAARLGDYDTARDHCHAALTLQRHHHNLDGQAHSLGNLGYIAHNTGRYHQALAYYHQSIDLLRRSGDTYYEALAYDWTGQTHAALEQRDQAREVWREALKLYRQQGRDTDAERVQRQLDALDDSVRESVRPSPGAAESAEHG